MQKHQYPQRVQMVRFVLRNSNDKSKQTKGQGMMNKEVKQLLIVLNELQTLIGSAKGDHANDRDQSGWENGQLKLEAAFNICIETLGKYPQIKQGRKIKEMVKVIPPRQSQFMPTK